MQHQPFLIDFTDFGRNKMDYIKPYISKLESLVATWSELPLRRHRDSGVEAMWLHYLALNTARLFQSLGQDSGLQPFIEFVNESSHAPLIRCTGEKVTSARQNNDISTNSATSRQNRPILYAHKQRNPYDAFDSTNLANFVSVSFHSVLRPASPDADETAE